MDEKKDLMAKAGELFFEREQLQNRITEVNRALIQISTSIRGLETTSKTEE